MATILYKDGNSVRVEAKRVQQMLQNGYTVTPEAPVEKPQAAPTMEEADLNRSGILSDTEVRAAAKEAGIKNYWNRKIADLKRELGYVEEN